MLELFGHPFSSYTWKALIALHENDADFTTLQRSYEWLNRHLQNSGYACGDIFTLAGCAAAPALFYADWVEEIGEKYTALRSYRSRLLARPSVRRCVDNARPYRQLFPPGAPDRD